MNSCKNQLFFIYADAGTSAACISEWQTRFGQMNIKSKLVYADDIRTGVLNHGDGLVIPGGADVEYCGKLNGAGNTAIKDFVRKGGIYIGVCAGAYYAHSRIDWRNSTERIAGERELAFFNGTAEGPLIVPYSPLTNDGLTFVPIHYKGGTARVYYKGGPVMSVCETTAVTAYFMFEDKKYPAVIRRNIGKGLAAALSPHIEYTDEYLQSIHAPPCPHRSSMFFDIMEDILKVSASKES